MKIKETKSDLIDEINIISESRDEFKMLFLETDAMLERNRELLRKCKKFIKHLQNKRKGN